MHRPGLRAMVVAVALASLAAGGCRPEEQGRKLSLEPGVYTGETMPALNSQQTKALGDRGKLQQ